MKKFPVWITEETYDKLLDVRSSNQITSWLTLDAVIAGLLREHEERQKAWRGSNEPCHGRE